MTNPMANRLGLVRTELVSRIIWWSTVAIGLATCAYLFAYAPLRGTDSWFPMARAFDFIHSHQPGLLFDTLFFQDHIKFQYPPTSLLLLEMLRMFGLTSAMMLGSATSAPILNSINAALMAANAGLLAFLATKLLRTRYFCSFRVPIGPLTFLMSLLFTPNLVAILLGQIQVLLTLLFLLSVIAFYYNRRALAGALIGLAALVKPQFAPLALLALWRRDWAFVCGFGIAVLPLTLLSFALYGIENHLDYLKVLSFLSLHGEWYFQNQSVNGFLNRFLYIGLSLDNVRDGPISTTGFPPYIPAVYIGTMVSSLVLISIPFLMPRRRGDRITELLGFTMAATLFTMGSPIAWIHHYSVIAVAYVVTLAAILERSQSGPAMIEWALIGTSFLLTAYRTRGFFMAQTDPSSLVQAAFSIGVCLLVGTMLYELINRNKTQGFCLRPADLIAKKEEFKMVVDEAIS